VAAIDAVYTWVDGAWPGYDELLRSYATDRHDLNPNRYRDNLDTLKYSLRSLERFVPWIRQVYLVTFRPQAPVWLNHRHVEVVHHDTLMPPSDVPTFNSFAIVANLHRLDGLSRQFVYVEDDKLFAAPVIASDFFDQGGRPKVTLQAHASRSPGDRLDVRLSPWNRALAYSNHLLDLKYGCKRRPTVGHAPLPIDRETWIAMVNSWPDAFARTSGSRFRATENVAPEHLYPHFLLEESRGVRVPLVTAWRQTGYHPLNNVVAFQRANLARLRWQGPKFICMNDNFGDRPNPRVVALVRRTLETWFPARSRFEVE
jgi:stealth protein CR2/Stealth-like protein